jgi:hypothetical protein
LALEDLSSSMQGLRVVLKCRQSCLTEFTAQGCKSPRRADFWKNNLRINPVSSWQSAAEYLITVPKARL